MFNTENREKIIETSLQIRKKGNYIVATSSKKVVN